MPAGAPEAGVRPAAPSVREVIADQALLPPMLTYVYNMNAAGRRYDGLLPERPSRSRTRSRGSSPSKKGSHDLKFGARYSHIWISNPNMATRTAPTASRHDASVQCRRPETYPERLQHPGAGAARLRADDPTSWELFAQDKWQLKPRPHAEPRRPLRPRVHADRRDRQPTLLAIPATYPVDKNNIAPRLGFVWNPDGQGKSVVRGGYGMFYDRTLLGTVDNFLFDTKYSTSFTAQFPQSAAGPRARNGPFPTDPTAARSRRSAS